MRRLFTFGVLFWLSGCASIGLLYSEDTALQSPVASNLARLTIYRTGELQVSLREAVVKLDSTHLVDLPMGGYRMTEVAPGRHALEVDLWDVPGRCEVSFEAAGGTATYFEVSPRRGSFLASFGFLALPWLWTFPPSLALVGTVASPTAGQAAESSGKLCGGAFSIARVEPSVALPKLAAVRQPD